MKLPKSFIESFGNNFPKDVNALIEAIKETPPTSIRINRNKIVFSNGENVPWCDSGYYLKYRPSFIFDPLFHAGCYYVQEASSMFIEQAIKQHIHEESVVLDLCAAPGGKTTLALSILSNSSFVVANELIRSRAHILSENLAKTGADNYIVLNSNAACLGQLTHCFDAIIVDIPCSGEGMFRKDSTSIEEWSQENVRMCAKRQKEIIKDIWPALKPNGILIYSTCTFNKEENEDQISWIIQNFGADSLSIDTPFHGINSSIDPNIYAYRFFPHNIQGEGFFLSVLRKQNETIASTKFKSKQKTLLSQNTFPQKCKSWLKTPDDYYFQINENKIIATPKRFKNIIEKIIRITQPLYQSIHIATIKGKDLIPSHELALSTHLSCNSSFPRYELNYHEALLYLKKEALTVSDECPIGFVLVTFNNTPLGFIKNIGNRINNLYPNEWKIRTKHFPTVSWTVLSDQQL